MSGLNYCLIWKINDPSFILKFDTKGCLLSIVPVLSWVLMPYMDVLFQLKFSPQSKKMKNDVSIFFIQESMTARLGGFIKYDLFLLILNMYHCFHPKFEFPAHS